MVALDETTKSVASVCVRFLSESCSTNGLYFVALWMWNIRKRREVSKMVTMNKKSLCSSQTYVLVLLGVTLGKTLSS